MKESPVSRLLLGGILLCLLAVIYQNHLQLHMLSSHDSGEVPGPGQPVNVMYQHPATIPYGQALIPVNPDGSIDVRVKRVDDVIDVNIEEIDTYDKLNVHVKSSDNYALQNAGPLEVK